MLPRLLLRVAAALRSALPFGRVELALQEPDGTVRILALEGDPPHAHGAAASSPARDAPQQPLESVGAREDYSPGLWPDTQTAPADPYVPILDPAFVADRRLGDSGAQAVLAAPLRIDTRTPGVLVVTSRQREVPPAASVTLGAMAGLLAAAAEQELRWAAERADERRRRRLEALLPAIAEALDVRQVFLGMSKLIQEVVPHDILAFALLDADRRGVRVQAATDTGLHELPPYRFSNEDEALDSNWEYLLAYDLEVLGEGVLRAVIPPRESGDAGEVILHPGPAWTRFVAAAGLRSTLRVPIRSKDRPIGGVAFLSRRPNSYDDKAGALALRIADHVALALAHQELALEQQRIAQAEERARALEARVEGLSRDLERFTPHRALGASPQWKQVLALAAQVAPTDATVLLTGESGTGKEVVARYIHRGSPRARGPFVAINCTALPEQLLESELFGHERGAFTGALQSRPGRIEQAAGGVLFLDEVGEMPPGLQAKLLRVLQERELERLGGSRTVRADVRVVAATNRDPRAAIAAGALREDLYYRLSVFEIHLPPLRERRQDVLPLAEAFLDEIAASLGRPAPRLAAPARELLLAHSWPGNVRELRNAAERAVILCQDGVVGPEHLPISVAGAPPRGAARTVGAPGPAEPDDFPPQGLRLGAMERDLLQKALARTRNNKSQAAKLLGLSRGQLYSLLRRHGLTEARR